MTFASTATTLRDDVDATLDRFLTEQERAWSDPERAPVLAAVREFVLDGGKRLRPTFCYLAWRGAAGDEARDYRTVVTAGAALELFHCFALIHDDIIDGSTRRRGRPSLHEAFAAQHAERGWRGDPARFGRSMALLCGDLCVSWSNELFDRCDAPFDRLQDARRLFALARAEAVAGECLDVVGQAIGDHEGTQALDRGLRVAQLKTARYSVSRPMQIGAALGGADAQLLDVYAMVGEPLGIAFQLRDDVLGVFGDPMLTGKSDMDDLRQGKPTVLIAITFGRATEEQLRALRRLLGHPDLDEAGAATLREIIVASGALAATERRIEQNLHAAMRAIAAVPIDSMTRSALAELAQHAVARSA
jgi:geranylgeranyl diphosphate synthase type I